MSADLCRSFQELAVQTWSRLEQAEQTGLSWSEETNTETILLELMSRHPANVLVKSFTKHEEALNGADWEWWLGSPGHWLGMRVQAKRIQLAQEKFNKLQRYKPRKLGQLQIDSLINAAATDRLIPAYCLYVCSRRWPRVGFWPPNPSLGFGRLSPSGCLIGHAQAIRAVRSDALSKLAFILLPWHLLVCSCAEAANSTLLAQRAFDVLNVSAQIGLQSKLGRFDDGHEPLLFAPQEALPDYMRQFVEVPDMPDSSAEDLVRTARASERRIAGVVLISSEPMRG